jgi:hypothetical protein
MPEEEETLLEEEEEEFITSGIWRAKHNSLSRGAGADQPKTSRGRPLPKKCPTMTSTMPLLSLESAAMLCRVDPCGRSGLLFRVWAQKILCGS